MLTHTIGKMDIIYGRSSFCKSSHIYDHLNENPSSLHKHAYWNNKIEKYFVKLRMLQQKLCKFLWAQYSKK